MQQTMINKDLRKTQENYNCIDLVKFICSLLVCIIHIPLAEDGGSASLKSLDFLLSDWVGRLAVPFFFMASGFFLFRNMELYDLNTDRIKQYCFKLLRLYGLWGILLFSSGYHHLWYFGATISAVIILVCFLRCKIQLKYIFTVACVLYIIGLLGDMRPNFVKPLNDFIIAKAIFKFYTFFLETTRNGIFMGFIFVLMGAAFSKSANKMRLKTAYIFFVISTLLLLAEAVLVQRYFEPNDVNMYIFLPITVYFLFYIASNTTLKNRPVYKKLRIVGVLVYFMHMFVKRIVERCVESLSKLFDINLLPFMYLICVTITVAVAFVIERLSNKKKFDWIRYLYS